MLFHVNCFSNFKLSKQTIWEIRQKSILMALLESQALYSFSMHYLFIYFLFQNVAKSCFFFVTCFDYEFVQDLKFKRMTPRLSESFSVCGPCSESLFWYEAVFDGGGRVLFLG